MRRIVSIVALSSLLVAGEALAARKTENFDKSIPAEKIRTFSLENINGDVVVEASSGTTIEIHAVKTARGGDPDRLLAELEIRVRTVGDRLEIETIPPKDRGWLGIFSGSSGSTEVAYDVKLPADRDLEIETVNGGVDISGVSGRVRAESVNGTLAIERVSGAVVASTVNGSVSIVRSGTTVADTSADAVNGEIAIALDGGSKFDITIETVNGSIESDFPISVEGKWGPKSAHGTIGGGGAAIRCETVNGSIRIRKN